MSQALKTYQLMDGKNRRRPYLEVSEDLGLPTSLCDKLLQALYAAKQTIASIIAMLIHFTVILRPGDSHKPIVLRWNLSVMVPI